MDVDRLSTGSLEATRLLGRRSHHPQRFGKVLNFAGRLWAVDTQECTLNSHGSEATSLTLQRPDPSAYVADLCVLGDQLVVSFGIRTWSRSGQWQVWRVDMDGRLIQAWPGTHGRLTTSLCACSSDLYMGVSSEEGPGGEWLGGGVCVVGADGAPRWIYDHTEASRFSPTGMAVAGDGTIFLADQGQHVVLTVDATDGLRVIFGEFGQPERDSRGLCVPHGVTWAGERLFVSDSRNGRIVSLERDGTYVTSSPDGVLADPRATVVRGDVVMVADVRRSALVTLGLDLQARAPTLDGGRGCDQELSFPRTVSLQGQCMALADTNRDRVVLGELLREPFGVRQVGVIRGAARWPRSARYSPDESRIAICDGLGRRLVICEARSFKPLQEIHGTGESRLLDPHDLIWVDNTRLAVADPVGVVLFESRGAEAIWRQPLPDPHQMAFHDSSGSIFVADPSAGAVIVLSATTGLVTDRLRTFSSPSGSLKLIRPRALTWHRQLLIVSDEDGSVMFARGDEMIFRWSGVYTIGEREYQLRGVRGILGFEDRLVVSDHRNHVLIAVTPQFRGWRQ